MRFAASVVLATACVVPAPSSAQAFFAESDLQAPSADGPLHGRLLTPTAKSIVAVLIIPGSGPTDRDGNSPLGVKASTDKLLAQGLATRGITSLRIDMRGMFDSAQAAKDANAVTIPDYVADVRAWVTVLRDQAHAPCVWFLGHSEGGLVALASAERVPGVCGLVLVATPGRPLGEILREQLRANPANAPLLAQALPAIDALERGQHVDTTDMHPALQGLFNPAVQGFLISAFSYDPARMISGITKPVLIVQGLRDLQVQEADAQLLKRADPAATLALLPDVNHVLKSVTSNDRQVNLATYADAALPLAPGVVDAVADFIVKQ